MSGPRSIDWDSVAPLNPFDRTAAMVAGTGEAFELHLDPGKRHQPTPIAHRPLSGAERRNPEFADLTGIRLGRLTALGLAIDAKANKSGAAWVVRCVCGAYEVRRARYLKACAAGNNPGENEPCCDWCDRTLKLQRGHGRGIPENQKHFNRLRCEAEARKKETA